MNTVPGLLVCLLPLLAVAEVVVPIDTVDEHVNIRMFPDSQSERVGTLRRGESARLVQSLPEWHEIEIAGGATGFISVKWTYLLDEAPGPLAITKRNQDSSAAPALTTVPATAASRVNELSVFAASVQPDDAPPDNQENVAELSAEAALAALGNLEPVTFNRPEDKNKQHAGFIAEDIPELVAGANRNQMSTMDIVAVLTRVVQQQQQQIAELESRLERRE